MVQDVLSIPEDVPGRARKPSIPLRITAVIAKFAIFDWAATEVELV